MSIKVSIIIPIYNAEKYLEQCIASAVNQTLKETEIVLIDDGSKDGSAEICKKFVEADSRVSYYYKENEGLAAARQDGIERSSGEYIGFIDSDDWIEPDMYEKMYNAATENSADVVLCNCFEYDEAKRRMGIPGGVYNEQQIKDFVLPRTLITVNETGHRSNIRWANWIRIYKRSTIDENNLAFDRRFRRSQDLPFTFDVMLYAKNFVYLDEFLYHNRQDAGSLSRGYTKNMWKVIRPLIEHIRHSAVMREGYDYSNEAATTAFFLCVDSILNEFKPDAPSYFKRVKHIREIIRDDICVKALTGFDYKKLSKSNQRIFYNNMKNKRAAGLIFSYWYNDSKLKGKVVAPLVGRISKTSLYRKIRKSEAE